MASVDVKPKIELPQPIQVGADGGPGSGKTEFIQFLMGSAVVLENFHVLHEVASALWALGFPNPESLEIDPSLQHLEYVRGDLRKQYQNLLYRTQRDLQYAAATAAMAGKKKYILVDRPLISGAMYYPGGVEALAKAHETTPAALLDQCKLVFFFDSLAVHSNEMYMRYCYDKDKRPETPEQARELNEKGLALYRRHKNLVHMKVSDSPARKFSMALDHLEQFMKR